MNKRAKRKIDHISYDVMHDASYSMTCDAAVAAAAVSIMHRCALRRISIKSVSPASLMDISRLPDTGLIRGHIISSAQRDVAIGSSLA